MKCRGSIIDESMKICSHCLYMIEKPRYVWVNFVTKSVYVIVPKSGSTFISNNLEKQGYQLFRWSEFCNQINFKETALNEYFIWTFIRHPIQRFVSSFIEIKKKYRDICLWKDWTPEDFTLQHYIEYINQNPNFEPHSASQSYFLEHLPLHFMGSLDTFEKDIDLIKKKVNIHIDKSEEKNASSSHTINISPDIKSKIKNYYQDDMVLWKTRKKEVLIKNESGSSTNVS